MKSEFPMVRSSGDLNPSPITNTREKPKQA